MPFYDLRCPACGKEFNARASMTERAEKKIPCPECGGVELEAVFTGAPAYIKSRKNEGCPNSHVCGAGCRHAG